LTALSNSAQEEALRKERLQRNQQSLLDEIKVAKGTQLKKWIALNK
jgi:hypothetical protein